MYIYVYVYMYSYIYIYTDVHVAVHVHTHTHTHTHTHLIWQRFRHQIINKPHSTMIVSNTLNTQRRICCTHKSQNNNNVKQMCFSEQTDCLAENLAQKKIGKIMFIQIKGGLSKQTAWRGN